MTENQKIPRSLRIAVVATLSVLLTGVVIVVVLSLLGVFDGLMGTAEEPTVTVAVAEEPTSTFEPTKTLEPTPAETATLTPLPSPTALPVEQPTATPQEESTLTPETPLEDDPTPVITNGGDPPIPGAFDVYLGAPEEDGQQLLRWTAAGSARTVTEIVINPHAAEALRAGQYVYWMQQQSMFPMRANTAGAQQMLTFAAPDEGAQGYDFLPSATGFFLAWVEVFEDRYTISLARVDGSNARVVAEGELEPGTQVELVRLTNDGATIFFDLRGPDVIDALFGGYHNLHRVDVAAGDVAQLPGEPACGEFIACGARISPDGAFMARTLPPSLTTTPVVVTNLVNSVTIQRFDAAFVPENTNFTFGAPIFTPGGELVYMAAIGAPGLEGYRIVLANLVTGEQEVAVDLGFNKHLPLGWTGSGDILLTTREDVYDTWQFDLLEGSPRQIAGLRFLGSVVVEE